MNEKFTLTGGARIGKANATYPFADLYVDRNILKINASLIGKFLFEPKVSGINKDLCIYVL